MDCLGSSVGRARDFYIKKMTTTNWEQIEKRAKKSETALVYMREHPLTHEQAVEQTLRLKEKLEND